MKPKFRNLAAAFAPLSRTSLIVVASLCAAASANADQTWTGAADALWSTTGNWSGAALPLASENAVFNASSLANLTIDTVAAQSIGGITVTSPAGAVTLNNNTLTLGTGGINMSAATQNLTIGSAVTTASGTAQEWAVASGRTLTIGGALTGGTGTANLNTSAGGTIKVTSGTVNNLLGRFATLNQSDFAGLDASNNVVAGATLSGLGSVTYSPNPNTAAALPNISGTLDVVDVVNSNTAATTAFRLGSSSVTFSRGVRFNTAHATGLNWSVDTAGRTFSAGNGLGILVGPNVNTDVSFGGSGSIRTTVSSGAQDLYLTNHSSKNLTINCTISNVGGRSWRLIKSGSGKVIFGGNTDTLSSLWVETGTVQIGNGGATGALNGGGAYNIAAGTTLDFNRTDTALTVGSVIAGSGVVNQIGTGTVTLTGTNTYTGGTNINAGALAASSTANFGTGSVNVNGGGVQFATAFDLTATNVVIGSSGATFNTNGNAVTFANAFASGSTGSVTKSGAGALTLAATNNYSGGTTVNGGTLLVNGTGATGSGTVTVNTGATIGGTGSAAGTVDVKSGAILAPGASVGTLSAGGLNLQSGSNAIYEFGTGNDQVQVTTSGGLTINGGAITLYQEGTTTPFAAAGTYDLIGYSGSISGAGVSSLSVANPQPGYNYAFSANGSNVILTITTSGVISEWTNTGGDSWATAGNWSGGVPNGTGATANFFTAITAPSTVTLDGSKTVGAVAFNNGTNSYTITQGSGGSLTINNGANPGAISNNDGVHEISAPITLTSNTTLSTIAADDSTILSGVISGAGTVTKSGPGSLSLLGNNLMSGAVTLSSGTTTIGNGGLGTGSLSISGTSLVWASGNTQDISNRTITFGSNPVTFDTNGNDVELLTSAIGDSGTASFTKAGLGKLTLGQNSTFTGNVTISGGILQLGNGGATGSVIGGITNNAELDINLADGASFANVVSGTGALVHSGSGSLVLSSQNTHTGLTSITQLGATLVLTDPLNIQGSTLDYVSSGSPVPTAGGSISFGTLTAATFGGLSGNKNLVLENTTPAAVALTLGGNGQTTSYSGVLSGSGSLTKTGAGTLTLGGANTYTGATGVNGGTLDLGTGGSLTNAALTVTGTGTMAVSGGFLTAVDNGTAVDLAVSSGGFHMTSGTAVFAGILRADGSTGSSNSAPIRVEGGTLTAGSIILGRTGQNSSTEPAEAPINTNLYLTGGSVSVSGDIFVGTYNNQPNSTVVTRIDGGTLTVGGAINVGLNNGGRWSILDVNGGDLVSNGSTVDSGVVLGGGFVGKSAFLMRAGTATVERIQFGRAALDGSGLLRVTGGELYVGSGGIVLGTTGALFVPEIRLVGGTLAAKADWTTTMPINVSGTGNAIIKAADASNTAHDITLNGALTGTGSLDKEGAGILTLGGGHSHTGATTVFEGTLTVKTKTFYDSAIVDVRSGATLNLDFTGGDKIGTLVVEGTTYSDPGTYGAVGSGATTELAGLTGSGLLYIGIDPPASAYDTWASAKGLTVGLNDGPNADPDNDGVENQLEFVLGGDPLASSTGVLPTLSVTPTSFIFTFNRNDDSEAEVALAFEHGNDLSGWTPITIGADTAGSGAGVVVSENAADPDTVQVTISRGTASKIFGRLRAVK